MNSPAAGIRASDAERELTAKLLQTAAGEGRLSPEEAGDRLAQASAARYRHELDQLVDDLPTIQRDSPRGRSVAPAFWFLGGLVRAAAFFGLMMLFWRFAFWPIALIGVFGFFALTRAMRYRWYARREWMMRRGWPDRWATVVR